MSVDRFIHEGFVRLEGAFSEVLAAQCRDVLWRASGCSPDDPSTWTKPVIRIGELSLPMFREAASTPALHAAFDELVGRGQWLPRGGLGTFPLRFPSHEDPGDTGWHIDVSFGFENEPDFMKWRANVKSKGRALLMLFLFSDVGEADAPTKLRIGSHRDIAKQLAPHGDEGLSLGELDFTTSAHRDVALATGPAGTVYLCHPFIVHSAQPHHGTKPRFIAQPPLLPRGELDENSPVLRAIR
ncbi:MAG: phytanoyl-CoA dioxygenase [Archangium sp.]